MSKSLYHENKQKYLLQAAWYSVTEVLNYETSWSDFHNQFPNIQVDIQIQRVEELETSDTEMIQFQITTSDGKQEHVQNLILDNFGVKCLDRFNYPEGFRIPDSEKFAKEPPVKQLVKNMVVNLVKKPSKLGWISPEKKRL